MKNVKERMEKLGWHGVIESIMTVHDVPFSNKPEELIPSEHELAVLRKGFDKWFSDQRRQ